MIRTAFYLWCATILGACSAFATDPTPPKPPETHVVFSLDGTLIRRIPKANVTTYQMNPERIIEVDGAVYRIADNAEKILRELQKAPRLKLHFASAKTGFAKKALDAIATKTGVKCYDGTAPSEFQGDDLARLGSDLSNSVVITRAGATDELKLKAGQAGQILSLGKDLYAFDRWADVEKARAAGAGAAFLPANESEWNEHQAALSAALAAIATAHDLSGTAHASFVNTAKSAFAAAGLKPRIEEGAALLKNGWNPKSYEYTAAEKAQQVAYEEFLLRKKIASEYACEPCQRVRACVTQAMGEIGRLGRQTELIAGWVAQAATEELDRLQTRQLKLEQSANQAELKALRERKDALFAELQGFDKLCESWKKPADADSEKLLNMPDGGRALKLLQRMVTSTPAMTGILARKGLDPRDIVKEANRRQAEREKTAKAAKPAKTTKPPGAKPAVPDLEASRALYQEFVKALLPANSPLPASYARCLANASKPAALDGCFDTWTKTYSRQLLGEGWDDALSRKPLPETLASAAKREFDRCVTSEKVTSDALQGCIDRAYKQAKELKTRTVADAMQARLAALPDLKAAEIVKTGSPLATGAQACVAAAVEADPATPAVETCYRSARDALRLKLYVDKATQALTGDSKATADGISEALQQDYLPCLQEALKGSSDAPLDDSACLAAAKEAASDGPRFDSLKRKSAFARNLLDEPENYRDLGGKCIERLKAIYSSGKTLYSENAVKQSIPVSSYKFASGDDPTRFFHYTNHRAMLDQFHPEIEDRKEAHQAGLKDGTYDKAFLFLKRVGKTAGYTTYHQVLYVAADPTSSADYGGHRVSFKLSPRARVLKMQEQRTNPTITGEVESKYPGLFSDCAERKIRRFIYEDSGIDLVSHCDDEKNGDNPCVPKREDKWFQLLRPTSIAWEELQYPTQRK